MKHHLIRMITLASQLKIIQRRHSPIQIFIRLERKHPVKNKFVKHLALEAEKVRGHNSFYTGKHSFNPGFDIAPLDLSFKKRKTDILAFYVKRILRKLDKITGYPIALVNLRDPDLVIPNRNILNFNPGFARKLW